MIDRTETISKLKKIINKTIAAQKYYLTQKFSILIEKNCNQVYYDQNIILNKINEIIIECLNLKQDREIKWEDSFAYDLGSEDMDVVEIIMAIEEEFDLEIVDDVAQEIDMVQKIYKFEWAAQKIDTVGKLYSTVLSSIHNK